MVFFFFLHVRFHLDKYSLALCEKKMIDVFKSLNIDLKRIHNLKGVFGSCCFFLLRQGPKMYQYNYH